MDRLRKLTSRPKRPNNRSSSFSYFRSRKGVSAGDQKETNAQDNASVQSLTTESPPLSFSGQPPPFTVDASKLAGEELGTISNNGKEVYASNGDNSAHSATHPLPSTIQTNASRSTQANGTLLDTEDGMTTQEVVRVKTTALHARNRKLFRQLLAVADTSTTMSDAVASSANNLFAGFQTLKINSVELSSAIDRQALEVRELGRNVRSMRLDFDKAHGQLLKARAITRDIMRGTPTEGSYPKKTAASTTAVHDGRKAGKSEWEDMERKLLALLDEDPSEADPATTTELFQSSQKLLEKYQQTLDEEPRVSPREGVRRAMTRVARHFKDTPFEDKPEYIKLLVEAAEPQELLNKYRDEDRAMALDSGVYDQMINGADNSWGRPWTASSLPFDLYKNLNLPGIMADGPMLQVPVAAPAQPGPSDQQGQAAAPVAAVTAVTASPPSSSQLRVRACSCTSCQAARELIFAASGAPPTTTPPQGQSCICPSCRSFRARKARGSGPEAAAAQQSLAEMVDRTYLQMFAEGPIPPPLSKSYCNFMKFMDASSYSGRRQGYGA